jgi:nitrogen fixation protein
MVVGGRKKEGVDVEEGWTSKYIRKAGWKLQMRELSRDASSILFEV